MARFTTVLSILLALAGCHHADHAKCAHEHDDHAEHREHGDHGPPPAIQAGQAIQSITLPTTEPPGSKPATVLLQSPAVKIVTIRVKAGGTLREHSAPSNVLVQAASGSGSLVAGTEKYPLNANQMVVIPANASHSVVADSGSDLVLVIHHYGGGGHAHLDPPVLCDRFCKGGLIPLAIEGGPMWYQIFFSIAGLVFFVKAVEF